MIANWINNIVIKNKELQVHLKDLLGRGDLKKFID
jgi:hypothetical protein